jgi:hypothetical protein
MLPEYVPQDPVIYEKNKLLPSSVIDVRKGEQQIVFTEADTK